MNLFLVKEKVSELLFVIHRHLIQNSMFQLLVVKKTFTRDS